MNNLESGLLAVIGTLGNEMTALQAALNDALKANSELGKTIHDLERRLAEVEALQPSSEGEQE